VAIGVTDNVTYADSSGRKFSYTQVTSSRSEDDVLDEVSVLPPVTRSLGTTATSAIPFETVNRYDAQRRLIGITSQGGGATNVITSTAWDAAGRPTAGTNSTGGPFTITYDENGNPSQLVQSYGGTTVTTRTTINSTGQACR